MKRFLALALTLAVTTPASAHTFDLDSKMPPHLAAVFAVNWFGIPKTDPQTPGLDPGWGNWLQKFPQCGLDDDPTKCTDFGDAGRQRWVASKRRPLAGIYSSSGRDEESKRRIDLMLSTTRRACDPGARLDAFILQLDSIKFTSAYPQNQQSGTWDTAYRATVSFLERADLAKLPGSVWVGSDATVYWHFGSTFGLNTQAQRKAALQDDIVDMAKLAAKHASSVSIGGKPFLAFYVDSALMTSAEWQAVLDGARQASGIDFYALATTLNPAYFAAFDALSPWVNLGVWANSSGANLRARGADYGKQLHAQLVGNIAKYPGRVVFGGVAPGFDDFTENWGACTAREIPRDPDVLAGQMDYLGTLKSKGVIVDTWDDWTEGTEIEPDVVEGAAKLVQLKQLLGVLYGESADPSGDQALANRWASYGQARSCCFEKGPCEAGAPPVTDLSCTQPPADAGLDASSSSSDASMPGADENPMTPAAPGSSGGCGCNAATASGDGAVALVLVFFFVRRKRT